VCQVSGGPRGVRALGMRYERLNVENTWTIVVRQPGMSEQVKFGLPFSPTDPISLSQIRDGEIPGGFWAAKNLEERLY